MQINPYLSFQGNCEEAFQFYEAALGGRMFHVSRYSEMPGEFKAGPEMDNKLMHARIEIGSSIIMGSDVPLERYKAPQGMQLSVSTSDPAEAERAFAALAVGGQIQMPLAPTFWASRFGMLVDRFGISWMVNCEEVTK